MRCVSIIFFFAVFMLSMDMICAASTDTGTLCKVSTQRRRCIKKEKCYRSECVLDDQCYNDKTKCGTDLIELKNMRFWTIGELQKQEVRLEKLKMRRMKMETKWKEDMNKMRKVQKEIRGAKATMFAAIMQKDKEQARSQLKKASEQMDKAKAQKKITDARLMRRMRFIIWNTDNVKIRTREITKAKEKVDTAITQLCQAMEKNKEVDKTGVCSEDEYDEEEYDDEDLEEYDEDISLNEKETEEMVTPKQEKEIVKVNKPFNEVETMNEDEDESEENVPPKEEEESVKEDEQLNEVETLTEVDTLKEDESLDENELEDKVSPKQEEETRKEDKQLNIAETVQEDTSLNKHELEEMVPPMKEEETVQEDEQMQEDVLRYFKPWLYY